MTRHVIAIDPGLTGAIALLTDGELVEVVDMPTATTTKRKKGKTVTVNTLDVDRIVAIIDRLGYSLNLDHDHPLEFVIEAQSTRPGQAAQSVLKTGTGYGVLIGIAAMTGHPWHTIRPQEWKKEQGLSGIGAELKGAAKTRAIKTASRHLAAMRWPDHALLFARAKDDGRAEAALIGDAWLRMNGGAS